MNSEISKMRMLVEAYYDIQKVRIEQGNRIKDLVRREVLTEQDAKELHYYTEGKLKACESDISKMAKKMVELKPIWQEWLQYVKGIGFVLAAGLISYADPSKFNNISKMWKYFGLHVVMRCGKCDRRLFADELEKQQWKDKMLARFREINERVKDKKKKKTDEEINKNVDKLICKCDDPEEVMVRAKKKKGELADWNPKAKVLQWKIGESFVIAGKAYKSMYDKFKREETNKHGETLVKAHIHARAKRKTVKLFLAHYWLMCRKLLGLETRSPYSVEKGHQKMIPPLMDGPEGEIIELD